MKYSDAANHLLRIWEKLDEYKNDIPEELYREIYRECNLFLQELMDTFHKNEAY